MSKNIKRIYLSQSDVPATSLEKAITVATTLKDNFGSRGAAPHQVAMALDISPTSSNWKFLTGSSVAYGLVTGGAQASEIGLSELGKKIVAPKTEGEDELAIVDACLRPKVIREFFEAYDKNKFPKEQIAKNVLESMGVPREKLDTVYDIIIANGNFAKIIHQTKTGPYVYLDRSRIGIANGLINGAMNSVVPTDIIVEDEIENRQGQKTEQYKTPEPERSTVTQKTKVFISHGKNKKMLEQLKEILTFGQFDVVISIEKESAAIGVPEKVFSDMRSCQAAVIHVEGDMELTDKDGTVHNTINENVLIEIGAAIALYDKKFILLCEDTLKLPSNLQGLYRCNYSGKELTYEASMKLQRTFNEIRSNKA